MRATATTISAFAGCHECGGSQAMWETKNAMALAARHHDATGHATWCEQILSVRYGERRGEEQLSLFDGGEAAHG